MARLTTAQEEALDAFLGDPLAPATVSRKGILYSHGGVSRPTAAALVRLGLAEWETRPHNVTNPGVLGRRRYTTEWALQLTAHGRAVNAQRAAARRLRKATGD